MVRRACLPLCLSLRGRCTCVRVCVSICVCVRVCTIARDCVRRGRVKGHGDAWNEDRRDRAVRITRETRRTIRARCREIPSEPPTTRLSGTEKTNRTPIRREDDRATCANERWTSNFKARAFPCVLPLSLRTRSSRVRILVVRRVR